MALSIRFVSLLLFLGTAGNTAVESVYSIHYQVKGTMQWWFVYDELQVPTTTMRLRRAEIILLGDAAPYLSWMLMVDPTLLKEDTDKKGFLLDFVISLKPDTNIFINIGQFRIPFGMEGLELTPKLDFIERSSMSTQLKWSAVGDIGFQLTYRLHLNSLSTQTTAGLFNGEGGNRTDLNEYKDICIRQTIKLFKMLHLGGAYYYGRKDSTCIPNSRTGIEIKFEKGPLFIQGELADGKSEGKNRRCYYLSSGYKFFKSMQGLAKYDRWILDKTLPTDTNIEITLGLNYFFANYAKLQLNYCLHMNKPSDVRKDIARVNVQVSF